MTQSKHQKNKLVKPAITNCNPMLQVALVDGHQRVDCLEVRFGLRTVEAKQREIRLNGEPLKLLGRRCVG